MTRDGRPPSRSRPQQSDEGTSADSVLPPLLRKAVRERMAVRVVEEFARLPIRQYKVLCLMCLDARRGRIWFGDWRDLARAMGRAVPLGRTPEESRRRRTLRDEVRRVCRELEAAGTIERLPIDAVGRWRFLIHLESSTVTAPDAVVGGG